MATETTLNRRQLVKFSASAAAGFIIASTSTAQESALSESDPTAMALGYAEDATTVDTGRIQQVDATQAANRSAGVSNSSVFRGLSFNSFAMALSWA